VLNLASHKSAASQFVDIVKNTRLVSAGLILMRLGRICFTRGPCELRVQHQTVHFVKPRPESSGALLCCEYDERKNETLTSVKNFATFVVARSLDFYGNRFSTVAMATAAVVVVVGVVVADVFVLVIARLIFVTPFFRNGF